MGKQIFHGEDARNRLFAGIKTLYDAVAVTYGPKGGNVVIMDNYGVPSITHDGVTVAESIAIEETPETAGQNVGIELIKQAATKLNSIVGDGTTTVTVLTYHIIDEANKLIEQGVNPQNLRKELEKASERLVSELEKLIEPIDDQDTRLKEVATVSAGDREIGNLIANIVKTIGKDGVITVEPGQSAGLESEIVEGYTFKNGYKSPLFVTDQSTQQAVIDEPVILLSKKTLNGAADIVPILNRLAEQKITNIVVSAEDIKGDSLKILLVNKIKGALNTVAVEATSDQIDDLAITTGAMIMSNETGINAENASIEIVGRADKVIVTDSQTSVISGKGDPIHIKEHLESLKAQNLDKRYADVSGKAAIIKVGGNSETEIDEKKYRVDDAVAATKAALEHGIVAGGGVTLLHLASTLQGTTNGEKVLKEALTQPIKKITDNAQLDSDAILTQVKKSKYGQGVDVLSEYNGKLIDLKDHGVIDPAQVTKESLLSSISIASTVITIGALIVNEPK